ncbi:MAG: hypothetical protein LLF98_03475 [Clostridium sp.]|uniref:hypothetical protein n=1 Tax=Clostridium sp. TaxID=1506 RepID=UPI0025BFB078|nr:hypothetical protein [Clostridium sp.]MCE5220334.1 hypothetical protein [Clostridium sp.]
MYDNRIISDSQYVVNSVNSSTVDNRITKRPYTNPPIPPRKKQNPSDSFDDTLHCTTSHISSDDDSKTFSNELGNMQRLKSEENSRLVQAKFNEKFSHDSTNSNKSIAETELHNKLSQAMAVEIDASTLLKKIDLLNSLRNKSNN